MYNMDDEEGDVYFSCHCFAENINITINQCKKIGDKLTELTHSNCRKEPEKINQTEFVFQVVLILVIGFFGLCGNIGAIHRFSRLKKATKFHHLMMLISIYDMLCILMIISIFSLPRISIWYKNSALYHNFAPIALSLTQVALTGSIYTTLAITIERYLIVCHPFYVVSHEWTSKMYILPIIVFSIVYNIPKFLELYAVQCVVEEISPVIEHNDNITGKMIKVSNFTSSCFEVDENFVPTDEGSRYMFEYFILPTNLRMDSNYYSIYGIWMNLVFMGTLPVITLFILNILIFKNLITNLKERKDPPVVNFQRQDDQRMNVIDLSNNVNVNQIESGRTLKTRKKKMKPKEIKLAKVGLYIVLIFVLCHSVRWIPNFYELSHSGDTQPSWVDAFMHISHFVIVLNSSVNFYIYCLTHLNVLEQVRKCFGKRAKYVRTRYASVSQSISTRRLSALTSLQTRNKSCSNSNLSEKAHNTRLQSIMEGMRESVTMPMLSSHLNTEDESDDEW